MYQFQLLITNTYHEQKYLFICFRYYWGYIFFDIFCEPHNLQGMFLYYRPHELRNVIKGKLNVILRLQ